MKLTARLQSIRQMASRSKETTLLDYTVRVLLEVLAVNVTHCAVCFTATVVLLTIK
jgi:hypothetical protein